jgi:HK97 gp10 family phage protein
MADPVALQVDGLKETMRYLKQMGDTELPKEIRAANKEAAQVVVEAALPNVPVRSGHLRASVKALAGARSASVKAGSAKVPYAAAIHWGAGPRLGKRGPHNIKKNPYLYNALDKTRDKVISVYEDAIKRITSDG